MDSSQGGMGGGGWTAGLPLGQNRPGRKAKRSLPEQDRFPKEIPGYSVPMELRVLPTRVRQQQGVDVREHPVYGQGLETAVVRTR